MASERGRRMNKRHIPGFFDALARTPSFVFLCSMFLCGAAAGGLTGLHAAEGDCALELTALLRQKWEDTP